MELNKHLIVSFLKSFLLCTIFSGSVSICKRTYQNLDVIYLSLSLYIRNIVFYAILHFDLGFYVLIIKSILTTRTQDLTQFVVELLSKFVFFYCFWLYILDLDTDLQILFSLYHYYPYIDDLIPVYCSMLCVQLTSYYQF